MTNTTDSNRRRPSTLALLLIAAAMQLSLMADWIDSIDWKRLAVRIIGGKTGAMSWAAAFTMMGLGYMLAGGEGLAVGTVASKITYIPYLYGVLKG